MGMKNYKPVFDGVEFKSPMQRMLEEQAAVAKAEADKFKKELEEVKGEVIEDGRTKPRTK